MPTNSGHNINHRTWHIYVFDVVYRLGSEAADL